MIRPVTVLTALLAGASGLYLYHAKHVTQVLDSRIVKVQAEIRQDEARISVLSAEWALENAPSRLADLAQRYLTLVPMQPSQAIRMADLDSRLPPPFPKGTEPQAPGAGPSSALVAGMPPLAVYASLAMLSGAAAPARAPAAISSPAAVAVAEGNTTTVTPPTLAPPPAAVAVAGSKTTAVAPLAVAAEAPMPLPVVAQPPAPESPAREATLVVKKEPVRHANAISPPPRIAPEPVKVVTLSRPRREPTLATPSRAPLPASSRPIPLHPELVAVRHAASASPPPAHALAVRATVSPVRPASDRVLASSLGGQYQNMPPPAPLAPSPSASR